VCGELPDRGAQVRPARELLQLAHSRIAANPQAYVDHIYGEYEAGGTAMLYISDVPFDQLGFRTDVTTRPLPAYTWDAMSKLPFVVGGLAVVLTGASIVTRRRNGHDPDHNVPPWNGILRCAQNDISCAQNDISCAQNDISCAQNDISCAQNDIRSLHYVTRPFDARRIVHPPHRRAGVVVVGIGYSLLHRFAGVKLDFSPKFVLGVGGMLSLWAFAVVAWRCASRAAWARSPI